MANRIVYFNGEFVPESEARVSIFDSALMFGDMAFEMTRTFGQEAFRLDDHLDRLYASLKLLEIDCGLSSSFALFWNLSSIEKSGFRRIRELNLQTRFLWHGSRSRWNLPSRSKRCYSPSRPFSPLPAFKRSAC